MNLNPNAGTFVGRGLVSAVYITAGINKISQYAGTQGYMEAMGVPGSLLPLVIALEIVAGLALLTGFCTRFAASALAVFTVVATALFHADLSDQMQTILFMKNTAIIGGLIAIAASGAGNWSIDHLRNK